MKKLSLLVILLAALGTPAVAAGPKIPVLYSTDLFHPHGDPDDHYDLATLFALEEFDLKGIVLDQGEEQKKRIGRPPLEQMMHLTRRRVPFAVGLDRRLRTPEDKMLDAPAEFQGGVELILSTLRETEEKVVLFLVGSCRDAAVAFNREPDLLKAKVKAVYCNAGNGPQGAQWEHNVRLDPKAYQRLFASGLPLYWCPCWAEEAGAEATHRELPSYATFFRADQTAVVGACTPAVQNFFVYCLTRSQADPIAFLSSGPHPLPTGIRHMWCTGPFLHAAGRQIYRTADGFVALAPDAARAAGAFELVEAFRFVPMRATLEKPAAAQNCTAPGKLAAAFLPTVGDRVGKHSLEPDGQADCGVRVVGLDAEKPIRNLVLTGPREGRWEHLDTQRWWRVAYRREGRTLDGFFHFYAPGVHRLEIVYADGSAESVVFTVPDVRGEVPRLRVELDPAEPNGWVFQVVDRRYEEILASCLKHLLAGLGRD